MILQTLKSVLLPDKEAIYRIYGVEWEQTLKRRQLKRTYHGSDEFFGDGFYDHDRVIEFGVREEYGDTVMEQYLVYEIGIVPDEEDE